MGESGIVEKFTDEQLSCKLMTMGVLPKSEVMMVRKAPLGGAYYLRLNGLSIAVRKTEAAAIIIK